MRQRKRRLEVGYDQERLTNGTSADFTCNILFGSVPQKYLLQLHNMADSSGKKSNAEAEEYVKNLGLEYSFGCLKENRADSCHQHGVFLEHLQKNFAEAFKAFKDNCIVRKFPDSCLKYAKYLITGRECEADVEAAVDPLTLACEGNVPEACHILSLVYYNRDREKIAPEVEKYMRRACELDDAKACWLLSTWYLGPVEGVEIIDGKKVNVKNVKILSRNPQLALKYGITSCELGMPQACANVSRMYGIGEGIEKNEEKANEFKNRALELAGIKPQRRSFLPFGQNN